MVYSLGHLDLNLQRALLSTPAKTVEALLGTEPTDGGEFSASFSLQVRGSLAGLRGGEAVTHSGESRYARQ